MECACVRACICALAINTFALFFFSVLLSRFDIGHHLQLEKSHKRDYGRLDSQFTD